MEALGYFLFWALMIFLMMRFGCGAHVMGHKTSPAKHNGKGETEETRDLIWEAPEKDRDPVCRKMIQTDTAKPSIFNGHVFYFCSRECREAFEAAPDIYIGEINNLLVPEVKTNVQ